MDKPRDSEKANEAGCPPFDEVTLLAALFDSLLPRTEYIRVVPNPAHTENLFGPIKEIAGKRLQLVERNFRGDCLCIFNGYQGTNLVDVDNRDVEAANVQDKRSAK